MKYKIIIITKYEKKKAIAKNGSFLILYDEYSICMRSSKKYILIVDMKIRIEVHFGTANSVRELSQSVAITED